MSIRLNIRSSSRTHISQTPRLSFNKLDSLPQRSKSQSGSRTRSHAPKPRPSTTMESPTPTPTPRRSRRHNKGSQRPEQRDLLPALQLDSASDREIISDDELLDLLVPTVTSIMPDTFKAKGILAVSKADINDSKKKGRRGKKAVVEGEIERMPTQTDANRKTPGGKKGNKKSHAVEKGFDVIEPVSDTPSHSTGTPTRKGKNNNIQGISKPSGVTSALAANKSVKSSTRANHDDYAHFDIKAEPFDMSILSRSLPSQHEDMANGIHNQRKGKKQNDLWDMPAEIATEVPTWQQQEASRISQSAKSSRISERKSKKAPSAFQPSGLNPSRPDHNRRRSTDGLPVSSYPTPLRSAPPLPLSAFDQDGSYHIGFNVNRAPQTPSKTELRDILASTPLPLIQKDFPRFNNKVFNNVLNSGSHPTPQGQSQSAPDSNGLSKSMMYAGPTSHYSPHARSLAKPELDEF